MAPLKSVLGLLKIALCAASGAILALQNPAPRPMEASRRIEIYLKPPSSLDEFVRSSDVVLIGDVIESPQMSDSSRRAVKPVVEHLVQAIVVLKGDTLAHPNQVIAVRQRGEATAGDGRETGFIDPDFPILSEGKRFMFVLSFEKATNSYFLKFGPASAYLIRTGQVTIVPAARTIDAFKGREKLPFVEFVSLLREAVRRAR